MIRPAVFVTAALLLSGCATPQDPSRSEPFDQAAPLAAQDPRVVSLAGALAAMAEDRHSLVGAARVSLEAPDLRFSRPQRVALMRPSSLRVEILGLFDQVAAILTTDGTRYQLYEPGSPEIEEGVAGRGLLWQVARIDLEPEEAVGLLLGAPVHPDSVLEAARSQGDGTLLIAFRHTAEGARRIFEFDSASRLVRVRHRAADGFLLWEAAYSDYRNPGDRAFAHQIDIDFPERKAHAAFHFQTAELNRDLPASTFVLERRSAELAHPVRPGSSR